MKIMSLIDRDFVTTSIFEDTRDATLFLKDHNYMAVVNEINYVVGILTRKDLFEQPDCRNILDCKILKPAISPDQTILEVIKIMCETGCDFLPVYKQNSFIGVISLFSIASAMALLTENKET